MPFPNKYFGIIENPLIFSPFVTGNDPNSLGPINNDFILLDGDQFKLLSGEQFDLLGS